MSAFARESGPRPFVTACPLGADIVAEGYDYSSEAAASIPPNGSLTIRSLRSVTLINGH